MIQAVKVATSYDPPCGVHNEMFKKKVKNHFSSSLTNNPKYGVTGGT